LRISVLLTKVRLLPDDSEAAPALVRDYYSALARNYDSWTKGFDRVMLGTGRSSHARNGPEQSVFARSWRDP